MDRQLDRPEDGLARVQRQRVRGLAVGLLRAKWRFVGSVLDLLIITVILPVQIHNDL